MTEHSSQDPGRTWLVYASPIMLMILVMFTMLLYNRTEDNETELRRLQHVRFTALRAYSDLLNAETGARGYQLTGQETYLDPYRAGADSVMLRLTELRGATRGDPGQDAWLNQLVPL